MAFQVGDAVLVSESYCKHCDDLIGKVGVIKRIQSADIQVQISPDFLNGWGKEYLIWCPENGIEKV